MIGRCHGNSALFDVGVGATCASNVLHKVPGETCPAAVRRPQSILDVNSHENVKTALEATERQARSVRSILVVKREPDTETVNRRARVRADSRHNTTLPRETRWWIHNCGPGAGKAWDAEKGSGGWGPNTKFERVNIREQFLDEWDLVTHDPPEGLQWIQVRASLTFGPRESYSEDTSGSRGAWGQGLWNSKQVLESAG